MKIHVATTTKFHLARLAGELAAHGASVSYSAYTPKLRMRDEQLDNVLSSSAFRPLLPWSGLAFSRGAPWQQRVVEGMLSRMDDYLAPRLPKSDVFIGLSGMAVASAAAARRQESLVILERGSRHVLSQHRLLADGGGLSSAYIDRELASYSQADVISVLSTHSADSFVEEGFDRSQIFVCPLGVDLDIFRPSPRANGPCRILFVGNWSFRKGVDVLVNALTGLPNVSLTHIGSIGDVPFPRRDRRFASLGHRSPVEIAAEMTRHHLLVLPSREDGFGMVLLEALAAGLPVVASQYTGGPDLRRDLAGSQWVEIVEPGSVADLRRGLEVMIDRESRSVCGDRPRERMTAQDRAAYSWSGYGSRYMSFLTARLAAEAGGE